MCITNLELKRAPETFLAYKIVRKVAEGRFISQYTADRRQAQAEAPLRRALGTSYTPPKSSMGDELTYPLRRVVTADWPGMYCWPDLKTPFDFFNFSTPRWGLHVLEVRIKKGTPLLWGRNAETGRTCFTTPRLVPTRVLSVEEIQRVA